MEQSESPFRIFASMILAGVSISLGAYAYLQQPGPLGAILFSIGLMAVIYYRFILFTGMLYKVKHLSDCALLVLILFLNVVGCWLSSMLVDDPQIILQCEAIVKQRATLSFWQATARGMGCGFLVTLAVMSCKKNGWSLVVGIPAFILAGFTHSVADAYYYCVGSSVITPDAGIAYLGTVLGNFIGGMVFKLGAIPADKPADKKQQ